MTTERRRTLALLDAIGAGTPVTQRHLSRRLGMALGLTNTFLKRMLRKGHIKITTIPGRRLLYALTPKGASEKIRLTYDYIHVSFGLYRDVVTRLEGVFREMERRQLKRAAFIGTPEMREIADLVARRTRVRILDAPGERSPEAPLPGTPAAPDPDVQAVLLASLRPEARTVAEVGRRFPGRSLIVLFPKSNGSHPTSDEPLCRWSPP